MTPNFFACVRTQADMPGGAVPRIQGCELTSRPRFSGTGVAFDFAQGGVEQITLFATHVALNCPRVNESYNDGCHRAGQANGPISEEREIFQNSLQHRFACDQHEQRQSEDRCAYPTPSCLDIPVHGLRYHAHGGFSEEKWRYLATSIHLVSRMTVTRI